MFNFFGALFVLLFLIKTVLFYFHGGIWRNDRVWFQWLHKRFDQWSGPAICLLGSLVGFCGMVGFGSQKIGCRDKRPDEALCETLQLFFLNISVEELGDSVFVWLAMIFASILASIIASKAIFFLFRDSSVTMRLMTASKHVVICGLGRIGDQILKDLVEKKDRRDVVIIEPDENHPDIIWAREQGAIVLIGDATEQEVAKSAAIQRASEVFVVTGSDESNIECAIEIADLLANSPRCRPLVRSFQDPTTWFSVSAYEPLKCYMHLLSRDLVGAVRLRVNHLEPLAPPSVNSLLDQS